MDEKWNSEELESERLEELYRKASDPVLLRTHLLMLRRVSVGDSLGEVAEMVGYSKKWTTEIVRRCERGGVELFWRPSPLRSRREGGGSARRGRRRGASGGALLWAAAGRRDAERAEGRSRVG